MTDERDIVFSVENGLARVLLNRPRALNALTAEMCVEFHGVLGRWARDPAIKALVIEGAGDRAFSAGGDIRKLYEEGRAGGRYPYDFYHAEYRLNAAVHHFPKPYIAVLNGIVMGGGVGVSVHGSHRIVTENVTFAMPETGIGLFPDVGGSYFLPRAPGELGMFLGLTGARLKAPDCLYAGIGTAFVPVERTAALIEALAEAPIEGVADVDRIVAAFSEEAGAPTLAEHRAAIDRHFAGETVEAIVGALEADGGAWAAEQARTIADKSPTSLKITFRQIRTGAKLDFDQCMRMEWRMVNRIIQGHDFYEGTRAVVIDKDQEPAWRPARLAEVGDDEVEQYFRPLEAGDLPLD